MIQKFADMPKYLRPVCPQDIKSWPIHIVPPPKLFFKIGPTHKPSFQAPDVAANMLETAVLAAKCPTLH